jgi:hypothetical protein
LKNRLQGIKGGGIDCAVNQPQQKMTATPTAAAHVLLVAFEISGSARRGFQVTASRDEGWISDGMFSRYNHSMVFPTREAAKILLDRILSGAHYCPRYNAKGRVCNLTHWVCTDGAFAKA